MPTLDTNIFDDIRALMKDRIGAVVDQFEGSVAAHLQAIALGLQEKNVEPIILAAHTLKSSAANMGAMHLSRLAQALEQAGKEASPSWDHITIITKELNAIGPDAVKAMRTRLSA